MSGFLKGAILGLILAVVIFVTAAILAPPVDQAKHSEMPIPQVEQDAALAAPEQSVAPNVSANSANEAAAEEPFAKVGMQKVMRPQGDVAEEDAVKIPERGTNVEVATKEPATPVVPAQNTQPTLPLESETPIVPEANRVAEAVPEDIPDVATSPSEAPRAELPQVEEEAAPEVTPDANEEPQERKTVRIDARENPVLRKPVTEEATTEEQPRVQSEAEVENAPPNALVTSPEAPRAIGKRVTTFGDRAATVLTNRLPSIGRESEAAIGSAAQNPLKPNALRDNSQVFDDVGLPLVSVILIEGKAAQSGNGLAEYITALNMPVSVAIDPLSEGSAERAEAYYAAGAEVLVLADFPLGATAQDVEVNLGHGLSLLQNAVAVLPNPTGNLPPRTSLGQVTAITSATGHGIVAQKQGLNSIAQLADRAGVPNVSVQRVVEVDASPESLRAQMNRAIFRASQDGSVVVLAHTDTETLKSLLAWGVADRPASVSMAPVSAILSSGAVR